MLAKTPIKLLSFCFLFLTFSVSNDNNTTTIVVLPPPTFYTTHWKLIQVNHKDINASTMHREPHVVFSLLEEGKGTFKGASGCNEMLGKYEGNDNNISIDTKHIAMTRMACPNMHVETQFLDALARSVNWEMNDNNLTLLDINQTAVARFIVQEKEKK